MNSKKIPTYYLLMGIWHICFTLRVQSIGPSTDWGLTWDTMLPLMKFYVWLWDHAIHAEIGLGISLYAFIMAYALLTSRYVLNQIYHHIHTNNKTNPLLVTWILVSAVIAMILATPLIVAPIVPEVNPLMSVLAYFVSVFTWTLTCSTLYFALFERRHSDTQNT